MIGASHADHGHARGESAAEAADDFEEHFAVGVSLNAKPRHDEFIAGHFLLLAIGAVCKPSHRMKIEGDVHDGGQCVPSQIMPFEVR